MTIILPGAWIWNCEPCQTFNRLKKISPIFNHRTLCSELLKQKTQNCYSQSISYQAACQSFNHSRSRTYAEPELHDDVIKWKHFPRYWPFVRGIHRSPVNSPHKGQWRGALMLSLICVWINGWVNNRDAGDLRRYRTHYDVTVMDTWGSLINRACLKLRHG